jgi:hypothetical protein
MLIQTDHVSFISFTKLLIPTRYTATEYFATSRITMASRATGACWYGRDIKGNEKDKEMERE